MNTENPRWLLLIKFRRTCKKKKKKKKEKKKTALFLLPLPGSRYRVAYPTMNGNSCNLNGQASHSPRSRKGKTNHKRVQSHDPQDGTTVKNGSAKDQWWVGMAELHRLGLVTFVRQVCIPLCLLGSLVELYERIEPASGKLFGVKSACNDLTRSVFHWTIWM